MVLYEHQNVKTLKQHSHAWIYQNQQDENMGKTQLIADN